MAKKQTKKKQNQTAKITKALKEGNLGDAIEVVAKPIAKAIGLDEDCEGCNARKELLNFGDRRNMNFDIEAEEFRILNRFFTSTQVKSFHNKRQALKFQEINNKYLPKYTIKRMSCSSCRKRLVDRMRLLWEANTSNHGKT